jgi:NAD(P)H-hydrate epimerase
VPIPYDAGEPLTCAQIRALDKLAIEQLGIPGIVLMENAGRAAAEFVYSLLPTAPRRRVLILCGGGNNGGDGFVIARHLHNAGVDVVNGLAVAPEHIRGDALTNYRIVERMRLAAVRAFEDEGLEGIRAAASTADIIVDALLGSGSTGPPREPIAAMIRIANVASPARRVAIDIPSGLDADTGQVFDPCIRAAATVTMVAAKVGFSKPTAQAVVGRVVVVDIGVPRETIPGRKGFRHGP